MIVTLQTERVRTLGQVRAFVEGSEAVDFTGAERESVYEFVRRALVRLGYERLGKSDKGLVRRYLAKVTGLSRVQLTRLIGQHRETGRIEDRRGGAPVYPFERRYTRADIRQLAAVDAVLGQMSGPATRALMRRQYLAGSAESGTFLSKAGRTSSSTRAASTGSWVSSPAWTGSRSPT